MTDTNKEKDKYGRKTWDEEEYALKAKQRYAKKPILSDTNNKPKTAHDYLKLRSEQISQIDKLQKISFVSSLNSNNAGFYCDVCHRKFKDNLKYIDHLNSKEHLVNSGFDDDSNINGNNVDITLDQVIDRLRQLSEKKNLKNGDDGVIDFSKNIELRKSIEEKQREKKRLKRQRKRQKQQ
ncbi:hypothetical protein CANARDRAFT_25004 [[Candida] arabinofermentans NRRL YB-2248]|uniref:C2H2-type domain-containing protein n=1 Tax=[Candida] arabinofermentans NRRL YB-2248 TaxID=983967 RepID=A0A1E4SVJ7_9ASCO|nr:hypothetical protein CANARDRAFT_25004 [[Candida] arabinofermentans NRRL YB-2248]